MIEEFKRLTAGLPYMPKAIFPSEMFLFYREAKACNADHIIESGVGYGGSTRYLARLFPGARLTSIDKSGVDPGLTEFRRGDSIELLPMIVEVSPAERIAVLIDGPKGDAAVGLVDRLLKNTKVKFVAVHDMSSRLGLRSRDKDFRRQFGYLDAGIGEYLKIYPEGPGLTIFKC